MYMAIEKLEFTQEAHSGNKMHYLPTLLIQYSLYSLHFFQFNSNYPTLFTVHTTQAHAGIVMCEVGMGDLPFSELSPNDYKPFLYWP